MDQIVNKFLLTGDKFMLELHMIQPGVGKYAACKPFIKTSQCIDRFMKTGKLESTYKNDQDRACFQHDMAYGDYKDLSKRTKSDLVLRDKAKDGYQRRMATMVYNFFDKKS